ncbi:hypothetical protein WJX84_008252 [Apatococcus fuscideae]|uniref:Hexosyltransferase n=1 Tax=Apatococcus fuscideae TaxID=2026836 RepID=A0AAW1SZC3_9CHLO
MSQTRKHTQRDLLLLSAVCLALASSYCVSSTSSLPQSSLLPSHKSCRQRHPVKPKVKAVVGVLSAAGEPGLGRSQYAYARRRQLLRATWFPASSSDLARHEENGLLLRFLIGQSTSDASETSLQHEQESHGDLWRLPLQETSRLQLHQKVIQFFREATCKYEANYIIKIDDDKYVRLDRLVMSIPQWLSLHAEYVGCFQPRLFSPTAVHACLSPIRPVKRYFHFKAQALGQEHSHVAARDPTLQGLTSRNPLTIRWKPLLLAAVCLGLSVASWVVPNGAQASCFGSAATASPMSAADPEAPQEQTSGHTKVSRSADQYSMDAIDQGLAQPAIRVAVAVGVVISALLILRFTLDRDAPYQPKPHARFSKPVDGTPQGLDPKGAAGAQGSTPAAKLAAADTSAPQRSVPGTGSQLPRQQGLSRAPQTSGEVGYARQSPAAGAPAPSQQQGVGQRPSGGLQQGSGRLPSVPGEPDYVGKRPSNTRPSADQQANRQADSSSPSSASPVTSSTGGFFAQSARPQRPSAGPSGQQVSKPQAQPAAKSKQDSTVSGTVIKTYTTSSGDSTSRSGPGLSGTVYRQNGDAAETGWTRGSAAPIIVALGFLSAAISSLKPFSWRVKQRTGKSEAQRQPATGQSLEISFRGSQPVSAPAAGSTSQAGAERLEKYNIVHDLLCNTTKSPAAQDAKDNPVRGILKGAPAGQISKYDAVGQTVQQLLEAKGPSATPVGAVNSLIEANRENR